MASLTDTNLPLSQPPFDDEDSLVAPLPEPLWPSSKYSERFATEPVADDSARDHFKEGIFSLERSQRGRKFGRQAAIKYTPGSISVHVMRFTEAHVPSTKASLWKNIVKRMIEDINPLDVETLAIALRPLASMLSSKFLNGELTNYPSGTE